MESSSPVVLFVVASVVVMVSSVSIVPAPSSVEVQSGAELMMACEVSLADGPTLREARWYQMSDMQVYASVTTNGTCPVAGCLATTVDGRGSARLDSSTEPARLSLTIASSSPTDQGDFVCGVLTEDGMHSSATVSAVVNYFPEARDVTCRPHLLPEEPPFLTCSSPRGQPEVSLKWRGYGDSWNSLLPGRTAANDDRLVSTLQLDALGDSYFGVVFTCFVTSDAYPDARVCSLGPFGVSAGPTTSNPGTHPRTGPATVSPARSTPAPRLTAMHRTTSERVSPTDSKPSPPEALASTQMSTEARRTEAGSTPRPSTPGRRPDRSTSIASGTSPTDQLTTVPPSQSGPRDSTADDASTFPLLPVVSAAAGGVILLCLLAVVVLLRSLRRAKKRLRQSRALSPLRDSNLWLSRSYDVIRNGQAGCGTTGHLQAANSLASVRTYDEIPAQSQKQVVPLYSTLDPDALTDDEPGTGEGNDYDSFDL